MVRIDWNTIDTEASHTILSEKLFNKLSNVKVLKSESPIPQKQADSKPLEELGIASV